MMRERVNKAVYDILIGVAVGLVFVAMVINGIQA